MSEPESAGPFDVIVIGGGQSGLAVGYYLRRTGLRFLLLDAEVERGGAWLYTWESLRLFSPARWSSLPGYVMPGREGYPGRNDVLAYLREYERRYELPVRRPVVVSAVHRDGDWLRVDSERGAWPARAVVSATGTWRSQRVPHVEGREQFRGEQIHSAEYSSPIPFVGRRVLVVGGGNSGAQIFAELVDLADVTWVTRREPTWLPDDVDGRVLFDVATRQYRAQQAGRDPATVTQLDQTLGDIVMVPPVREARDRGLLTSTRMFDRFTERGVVWPDGREEPIDAVIWCTGFGTVLDHLLPLGVLDGRGHIAVGGPAGTRSVTEPRLWLVGYGEWTGYASATIIGVGRSARATVNEIVEVLGTD